MNDDFSFDGADAADMPLDLSFPPCRCRRARLPPDFTCRRWNREQDRSKQQPTLIF